MTSAQETKKNKIEILLVEDNPGDIDLTLAAFAQSKIQNNITVCKDGEEACNFLFKQGEYEDVKSPDVILLDINLPKKNGLEILAEVKTNEATKAIPVIMLTTSESEDDIKKSYSAYANSYLCKPFDNKGYQQLINDFEDFWMNIAVLPSTWQN